MKRFLEILISLISTKCFISSAALNVDVETEDFKTLLLTNDLFVDKSLLIDHILTRSDTTVIIRPNGWCKSTNMDMIRRFFEIEVDEVGSRLPKERTTNDKLFLGGTFPTGSNKSKTLKPLKITNSSDTIRHLGKYPVISLKLKNTIGNSYEEIAGKIKSAVTNTFQDHRYLLHSPRITANEPLRRYLAGEFNDKSLYNSLYFLSEKLHQHFDEKVIILIDDYETPVMNAYTAHGFSKKPSRPFHFHVERLLFEMYNAAFRPFRNPWVKLGLLVGEHLIPVDDNDCLLSCVSIFRPQYEPIFCEFYGFTSPEVQELLSKVHEPQLNAEEIKNWYNGYEYGGHQIYNSRSTMLYLAGNSGLKSFAWDIHNNDTIGYIDRILTSDLMQKRIQTLISEDSDFTYRTLRKYINMDHKSDLCSKEDQTRLLIDKGYLALDREPPNDILWRLYIPNNEMKHIFQDKFLHWVFVTFATDGSNFGSFAGWLKSGNTKLFAETLQLYHNKAAKYLETDDNLVVLYNGLITALQITLSTTQYIVIRKKDQWEDWRFGEGHDVHMIPKSDSSNVAIFMKCKVVHKENLQSAVNQGLNQIDVNLYKEEWRNYSSNIQHMVKLSIAICGEQLAVEYDTVN